MYNFDNFIFDMDGTLVNSSQEVINCFDKAFTKDYYVQDSISWLSISPVSLSGRYVSKIKISYKYFYTD